jgi:hypothetical protein
MPDISVCQSATYSLRYERAFNLEERRREQMNIDDLTIKQAREIAAMVNGVAMSAKVGCIVAKSGPERAVLVTTAHRGVFFGYATETDGETIKLRAARNAIYWPASNKGFLGLAADGPAKDARVGPPADIELRNITCVAEVTDAAVAKWEVAPWQK